jgi:hypothetical protein
MERDAVFGDSDVFARGEQTVDDSPGIVVFCA